MVEIISVLVIIGIISAILLPRFMDMSKESKIKAAYAGVAEYNGREKLLWTKMLIANQSELSDATALDQAIYQEMASVGFDLDSGTSTDWGFVKTAGDPGSVITATLTFKEEEIELTRSPATLETPARWSATGASGSGGGGADLGFITTVFNHFHGSENNYSVGEDGSLAIKGGVGLLIEGTTSSDFEATMVGSLNDGNGWGFFYRAVPNPDSRQGADGYCFQVDPGAGDRFLVKDAHTDRTIASVRMQEVLGNGYDKNAEFEISIDVVGDQHTIIIDGQEALSFSDDRYGSGEVGFRSWWGSADISSLDFTAK